MCIISFLNRLLTFLIAKCSRKYDICEEAHKLYHQDLRSVLQKFRKTPEYQKILEEKKEQHMEFVFEAYTQILFRHSVLLQKKVEEHFGVDKEMQAASKATTAAKSCFRMGNFRKNVDQESEKDPGIVRLDKYSKFYGKLTLAERNKMKDLGYTYAGHVIHAMLKAMGPDDDKTMKSTRQPYEDDELDFKKKTEPTTTEHVIVHEVPTTTEKVEEIPIETEKPEVSTQGDKDDEAEKKQKKKQTVEAIETTQVYKRK